MGNSDIEDSLQRLDKLTQEEAKMASAELLRITQSVQEKVMGVDNRVQDVGNKVQIVDDKLDNINRSPSLLSSLSSRRPKAFRRKPAPR